MQFVNRRVELGLLDQWWQGQTRFALIYGRRRVGKTSLMGVFAQDKRSVFVTGARRGEAAELELLSTQVQRLDSSGPRDLEARPYSSWDDALDDLEGRSADEPILLVLDEFPELAASTPALPAIIRAFSDRVAGEPRVRVLMCGSAVRSMEALQTEREPLYGRFDLTLPVHPFTAHEAALLLADLAPADRAVAYGVLGGMPLYLSWWDAALSPEDNIAQLYCEPSARMLTEADLVLATEVDGGTLAAPLLRGIAQGKTTYSQLKDVAKAEPARTLDRLVELRLVERVEPAGQRSKRPFYRIVDPMLSFYLGVVERYRTDINRGLGTQIVHVVLDRLDDHMGPVWEAVFREHLRYLAARDGLPVTEPVVAVGDWWDRSSQHEIDALVLVGRSARPALAGEAKWGSSKDASALVSGLRQKVQDGLGLDPDQLTYAVSARDELTNVSDEMLTFTAQDLFEPLAS